MSAGTVRISQAKEEAILAWFRLAPTLDIRPGLREIRNAGFSQGGNEGQIKTFVIKSFGRKITIQVQRSTDEAFENWGPWYASFVQIPSEEGSSRQTYLSLDGVHFWRYTG